VNGPGRLVPDEGNIFVTGLWNRVGIYRSLAALLLVGALAGGAAYAANGSTQDPDTANTASNSEPLNVADLERQDAERVEAERAARATAQRKADEAAAAAAEQAKKSPSTSSSAKSAGGKPGAQVPPAPASCQVYSGNRQIGCSMTLAAGHDLQQFACLEKLWTKESQWKEKARNPSSGAYGIPQSLPAGKMASAGGDYLTNPATQIKWGLGYIKDRYGKPCSAWSHSQAKGWY
jgi:hypothetical protein